MKKCVILFFLILFSSYANGQQSRNDNADKHNKCDLKCSFVSPVIDTTLKTSEFSTDLSDFSDISDVNVPADASDRNLLIEVLVLLLITSFIGIVIQYAPIRKYRGVILLLSIVYLGFIKGACPCMIMSLQNTILFLTGSSVTLVAMLWFLGLIVVTYFFGKAWCGWLCHLGGLQEFIFRKAKRRILTSGKSQTILKFIQTGILIILVVQLLITRTNIWVKYDPFVVAFNLYSANITGYVLLGILLLSSLFIYRPFCRMACPVGLILGWITRIPGATKLSVNSSCTGCKGCVSACSQGAIIAGNKALKVNTEDCILCGECFEKCNNKSFLLSNIFNRKNQAGKKNVK